MGRRILHSLPLILPLISHCLPVGQDVHSDFHLSGKFMDIVVCWTIPICLIPNKNNSAPMGSLTVENADTHAEARGVKEHVRWIQRSPLHGMFQILSSVSKSAQPVLSFTTNSLIADS